MTGAPDMVRFRGGLVSLLEVGWTGPWPPPERLGVAVGLESGIVTVFEPDEANVALLNDTDTIRWSIYQRRSASSLHDDIDRTRLFRGAEYTAEDE